MASPQKNIDAPSSSDSKSTEGGAGPDGNPHSRSEASSSTADQAGPRSGGLESPLDPDQLTPSNAEGGCWAVSLAKLGVFGSKQEAVSALDLERDEWTSLPDKYKVDSFLGTRSVSWHTQLVQRAVVKQGWRFLKCSALFLQDEGILLRATDGRVSELSIHNPDRNLNLIIYGLVNPHFMRGTTRVETFDQDGEDDTPELRPENWVHTTAVKNGKLQQESGLPIALKWLHVTDGGVDSNKGYFHSIDTIYLLRPPPAEVDLRSSDEEPLDGPSTRTRGKHTVSAFGVTGVLSERPGRRPVVAQLSKLSRKRLRAQQECEEGRLADWAEVLASREA